MADQSGDVTKRITAYNNGVEGSLVDIRSDDANLVFNTAVQTMEIVSGDVNDDFIPTGTLTFSSAVPNTFATGTATLNNVAATDTVTINGLIYLAVSGAATEGEFDISGGNDTLDAIELRDAINEDTRTGTTGDLTATASSAVVTATTDVAGTAGNSITLTSQDASITVSGSGTLTSGVSADVATINGLTYTAFSGTPAEDEFDVSGNDGANATSLKNQINADTRTPITVPAVDVTATVASAVVTINALSGGTAGNTIDTVGTANITAGAATLVDQDTAGAWTVGIEGLDSNFLEQTETVNLNGQIANALVNSYIFVSRIYIATAGTGGINEGVITLRLAGAGATQLTIAIGDQESQSANYIIPADKTGELILLDVTLGNDPSVVNSNQIEISTKDLKVTDSTFRLKDTIGVPFVVHREYRNGEFVLPPKTALQFKTIRPLGAVANKVNLSYTLILHRSP